MFYKVFTGKTCFPLPIPKTGSFTSSGVVVTIANNIEQLFVGDFLYSTSLNEIKEIISFQSDSILIIESPFSSDITIAEPINITDRKIFKKSSVSNFGGANGLLNGETIPIQSTVNIEEDNIHFTVDGTGTEISILAT